MPADASEVLDLRALADGPDTRHRDREDGGDGDGLAVIPPGRCLGRASTRELRRLHLVASADDRRFLAYAYLVGGSVTADASEFRLHFDGRTPVVVAVAGRDLFRAYDLVSQHRLPWVQAVGGGPVESITFEEPED